MYTKDEFRSKMKETVIWNIDQGKGVFVCFAIACASFRSTYHFNSPSAGELSSEAGFSTKLFGAFSIETNALPIKNIVNSAKSVYFLFMVTVL